MKKKKLYIGCALTHASEEFKTAIETLKAELRHDYEILDFIGLVKGTPQDVFAWDLHCVRASDLFVADCTYPAIGLGMEIGTALAENKKMLVIAHEDAKVTRIVLGITHPRVTFKRYGNHAEVIAMIREQIEKL